MRNFFPSLRSLYARFSTVKVQHLISHLIGHLMHYFFGALIAMTSWSLMSPVLADTHNIEFRLKKLGFALDAKPLESTYGEPVVLEVKVDGIKPKGKVVFYNGEVQLGEAHLEAQHDGSISFLIQPALDVGEHRLSAYYFSGQQTVHHEKAELRVKVNPLPVALELSDMTITYEENKTLQLNIPESKSQGTFSYSIAEEEHKTATVDKQGLVTIHDGGVVTIRVKQAAHGNYAEAGGTFKLTIAPAEGGITQVEGAGVLHFEQLQ